LDNWIRPARLLEPKHFSKWVYENSGTEILMPAANEYLQAWPVSTRVNSSRAADDDATLIDAIVA